MTGNDPAVVKIRLPRNVVENMKASGKLVDRNIDGITEWRFTPEAMKWMNQYRDQWSVELLLGKGE